MNVLLPRMKPVAPFSWELRARLLGTEEETPRITMEFPGPSIVVGIYPSVVRASAGALVVPTTDNILALVDLDNQERFTGGPSQGQTAAASRSSSYVTLESLSTRYRDLYWNLASPRPVLGITFRWKRFTAGAPLYEDCDLGVVVFVIDQQKALQQPGSQ